MTETLLNNDVPYQNKQQEKIKNNYCPAVLIGVKFFMYPTKKEGNRQAGTESRRIVSKIDSFRISLKT